MLSEVLLHLAGITSSLLQHGPTQTLHPKLTQHLHPGEVAQLTLLCTLASHAQTSRAWAQGTLHTTRKATLLDIQAGDEVTAVAACLLQRLELWEADLKAAQDDLLHSSRHPITLATLRARLSPWAEPLRALANLTTQLASPPTTTWSPAALLDLVFTHAQRSIGPTRAHLEALCEAAESVWLSRVRGWMCDARPAGLFVLLSSPPTKSSSLEDAVHLQEWTWANHAKPATLPLDVAESILAVGRALRALPRSIQLPPAMRQAHAKALSPTQCRLSKPLHMRSVVERIRDELGDWMCGNVLRPDDVRDTVEHLGDFFLHRSGLFHTAFLSELASLRRNALLARTASTATLRAADVELALHRAAAASSDASPALLAHVRVQVAKRNPLAPTVVRTTTASTSQAEQGSVDFTTVPLGPSFTLSYVAPFPLDLLLTRTDAASYSELFAYLLALRSTAARLRECWTRMSKAQRVRRRFTGTGEGGASKQEERARGELLRRAWGVVREGLWILEALTGHFQTDIIDVQHTRLMMQLSSVTQEAPLPLSAQASGRSAYSTLPRTRGGSSPDSQRAPLPLRSVRGGGGGGGRSYVGGAASVRGSLAPSRRAPTLLGTTTLDPSSPTTPAGASDALSFALLRSTHAHFLSYIQEGCLLRFPQAARAIKDVLATCSSFTMCIEEWGGDVLPGLLEEGAIVEEEGDRGKEKTVRERKRMLDEIAEVLRTQLDDLFQLLSAASTGSVAPLAPTNTPGLASSSSIVSPILPATLSASLSLPAPSATQLKAPSTRATEASLEASSAARRHLEQLLLRLDFSGWYSARELQRRERRKESQAREKRGTSLLRELQREAEVETNV